MGPAKLLRLGTPLISASVIPTVGNEEGNGYRQMKIQKQEEEETFRNLGLSLFFIATGSQFGTEH